MTGYNILHNVGGERGGDDFGVAVEEPNGQRPGDAPDGMASGRQVKCAAGIGGDGGRFGGRGGAL